MTLNATAKRPTRHRKADGKHHRHTKNYHKAYWPYLPIIAIMVAGVFVSHLSFVTGRNGVLGYATDMSVQELLDDTNAQRTGNGVAALSLNGQLDNSAQAKANDMAARDYWSHNTPDGQTPWVFFTNAGYNYQLAGENLAYGFATASDTLTGWMNSPEHRANILNSGYTEVGFGFVNIPNYQGTGPETLVVAHYAKPAAVAAAPTPSPAATTPTRTTTTTTSTSPAPSSASPSTNSDTLTPTTTDTSDQSGSPAAATASQPVEPKQQSVPRIEVLTAGNAAWSGLAITLIVIAGSAVFILRHGLAWHRLLRRGERFVIKHPLFDISLTAVIVLAILLRSSSGMIR